MSHFATVVKFNINTGTAHVFHAGFVAMFNLSSISDKRHAREASIFHWLLL